MKVATKFMLVFALLCLWGCASSNPPAPETRVLDCQGAMSNGFVDLSDADVSQLLDDSFRQEDKDCWRALIDKCLHEERAVPRHHLVAGIREFNRHAQEELFHLSVCRYLTEVALGYSDFRPEDRALLEAYVRLLINRSDSSLNPNLRNAQLLCRRLDSDLYRRFFE